MASLRAAAKFDGAKRRYPYRLAAAHRGFAAEAREREILLAREHNPKSPFPIHQARNAIAGIG
jgi:hypothetical protein